MRFAYLSDIGKRATNEDSLYVPAEGAKPLFLVADGMGGHKSGATASTIAAMSVAEYVEQCTHNDLETMAKVASAYANAKVYAQAQSSKAYEGMGTTLAFVYAEDDKFVAANVGDSRIYHYDGMTLTQITKDHSYVAALLMAGKITETEAENHPQRNMITRAIGINPIEQADIFEMSWKKGDILLLCTDGLPSGLNDSEIKSILKGIKDINAACRELVESAKNGGAADNITVILVENEVTEE